MRTGVDLISVRRLEGVLARHGDRFLNRVYTEDEKVICAGDPRRLAGRYAAKEAVSKALGSGIGREGISFRDIEILRDPAGAPRALLHGAARALYERLGGQGLSLSISHENEYAVALCVLSTVVHPGGETADD
ncbi:MAG: holo-ACP synthase [Clostridiaceae bacterium]|nr:holo-ACP synthase [Clostridiaceae bacterium]